MVVDGAGDSGTFGVAVWSSTISTFLDRVTRAMVGTFGECAFDSRSGIGSSVLEIIIKK
jgi:hypothetical protein